MFRSWKAKRKNKKNVNSKLAEKDQEIKVMREQI
jgi:hypothetical protein